MNIYEMYGRQAEQMQQSRAYFDATQKLLADLQDGSVLPPQLVITQTGWELAEKGNTPENEAAE